MTGRVRRYVHVSPTNGRFESRLLKQAQTALDSAAFDDVLILAKRGPRDADLPREETPGPGLTLRRIDVPRLAPGLNFVVWMARAVAAIRAARPTAVSVHHVLLLPLGVVATAFTGARLVYDAHELETETTSLIGKPIMKAVSKAIEAALIGFCDHVIVVNDAIAAWYRARHPKAQVTAVLNAPRRAAPPRTDYLRRRFAIPADKTIFLYQGVLTTGRAIPLMLEAFGRGRVPDGVLVLMGYGELQPQVEAAAAASEAIFFHPAAPPDQLLAVTASADVGMCVIEPVSLSYRLASPNKLFECIMARTPPVVAEEAVFMRDLVRARGLGVVVARDDDGFAAALQALCVADRSAMAAACAAAAEELSWEGQAQRLIALYRTLSPASARS